MVQGAGFIATRRYIIKKMSYVIPTFGKTCE
jgi:hypothetical protein